MANNNGNGGRQVTIVNYRECRRNHATQRGRNAVDGCLEFLKAGDRNREALLCAACGCHRSFHRKEEVPAHVDPGVVQILQQMAAAAAAVPPPPHNPLPAPAADQEENLDLGAGEVDEEVEPEREPRRRGRTRLTPPQKEAMKEQAEKLEWSLQGHDEEELLHFCLDIGISPQVFKVWMKNNKGKYAEAGETSSAGGF